MRILNIYSKHCHDFASPVFLRIYIEDQDLAWWYFHAQYQDFTLSSFFKITCKIKKIRILPGLVFTLKQIDLGISSPSLDRVADLQDRRIFYIYAWLEGTASSLNSAYLKLTDFTWCSLSKITCKIQIQDFTLWCLIWSRETEGYSVQAWTGSLG